MSITGIVRNVDPVGRIVIPVEIRKVLGISIGDPIEILVDEGKVILEKFEGKCFFCGQGKRVKTYKEKPICTTCRKKISSL
ncbi:MAG: AbrB/MazE/SpoVT family DNA-binding domain-containing protein [Actinomycetia bacterium]|nr:AbrB/MazE/SpoVT family DNA-binding domain-containing protein [Actinomycetes bacterium]